MLHYSTPTTHAPSRPARPLRLGVAGGLLAASLALFLASFTSFRPLRAAAGLPVGDELLFCGLGANDPELIAQALDQGASLHARDAVGYTPLMWAASLPDARWADTFLRAGAEVNARAPDGSTPLTCAAQDGHPDTVRHLLAAGADPHAVAYGRRTALHLACRSGRAENVRLLLAAGADPNARDGWHRTPLIWAAECPPEPRVTITHLLLAAGANPSVTEHPLTEYSANTPQPLCLHVARP